MDQEVFNTIVLVEPDRIFIKSDAVLEIASKLREPFRGVATLAKVSQSVGPSVRHDAAAVPPGFSFGKRRRGKWRGL